MGARLKALWLVVYGWVSSLSTKTKAAILFVGAALLVAEYRELMIDLIVKNSKKILNSASSKDQKMAAVEDADKTKATALVAQADALVATKPEVDENWNRK